MILAQEKCEINTFEGINLRFDYFIICNFLIHVYKELRRSTLNEFDLHMDDLGEYTRLPMCFFDLSIMILTLVITCVVSISNGCIYIHILMYWVINADTTTIYSRPPMRIPCIAHLIIYEPLLIAMYPMWPMSRPSRTMDFFSTMERKHTLCC